MIYLGRTHAQKQAIISEVCDDAHHAVIFHGAKTAEPYDVACTVEYRGWGDVIMYKHFYRLLEEITPTTAIILDEIMRTQNRNDLTYNCLLHYIRKAGRCTVFQYFPIIDDIENFCILADMESCGRSRGRSFDAIGDVAVDMVRRDYQIIEVPVTITDADRQFYRVKKEEVFSQTIKDPESLPRQVALVAGNIKAKAIDADRVYVARNARFKAENIMVYGAAPPRAIILDPPVNAITMHDHLTGGEETPTIRYMNTGLPVDVYYIGFYRGIAESMRRVYDCQKQ